MKQHLKIGLQTSVLFGFILPAPASAGVLNKLQTQCLCLTEHATLGQLISLGVMLTLVASIVAMKWIHRKEVEQSVLSKQLNGDESAVQILKQLKIGEQFSSWSDFRRIAGQKQTIS